VKVDARITGNAAAVRWSDWILIMASASGGGGVPI
jgi:hypothetical protein